MTQDNAVSASKSIDLTGDDLNLVRSVAMFRVLPFEIVEQILSDCSIEEYQSGDGLFLQGERAEAFFIVLSGWIKLYRVTAQGDETVIGVFTRGQSFAEAVALVNKEFPASCEAVTDARLVRVPCVRLRQRIMQKPEIGLAMIASTAQHLHLLVQEVEQLKARTGAERVSEFLLSLTDVEQGAAVIALPYEKMLIAGRLGMTQETLSRSFARLRRYGVKVSGRMVNIADVDQLRQGIFRDNYAG